MNTKSLLFSLILLVFLILPASAQIWISNNDIYEEANNYLNAEDYVEALPLFMLLEKKGITNANVYYKVGTCYLHLPGRKDKSLPYLQQATEHLTSSYKDTLTETRAPLRALLELGVSYRINNQLKKAIEIFRAMKDSVGTTDSDMQVILDMHIKRCQNAMLLGAFPGAPRTKRLPDIINDQFSNYNPVLADNGNLLYYMEQLKFYDALMESKMQAGHWTTPENLTPDIHSDGDYILLDASADGKRLLLYNYKPLKAGEIYEVDKEEDGGWSKIRPLNNNINTQYNETHASFSHDGKTLYFTSNRPGGFGGLDIYMSKLDSSGDWGPAVNLGPTINTAYNEETPFMNDDNDILYFSSQGHLNMGGYDVFYSLRKGKNGWREPINMGSPVCTTDDDLFYFPLEEGSDGLMSRLEANSATGYDIYQYTSMVLPNTPRYAVRGKAGNNKGQENGPSNVYVVDKATSDTVFRTKTDTNGDYQLLLPAGNFAIVTKNANAPASVSDVSLKNDIAGTLLLASAQSNEKDTTGTVNAGTNEKIAENSQNAAETGQTKMDSLIVRDILFAFDQTDIKTDFKPLLDSVVMVMKKYPDLRLLINGYTDSKGSQAYNLLLSAKRAGAVADYLKSRNIASGRLKVSGKGESDPVALNKTKDGSDNPEGRKYNRRVSIIENGKNSEITIIHYIAVPRSLRISDN